MHVGRSAIHLLEPGPETALGYYNIVCAFLLENVVLFRGIVRLWVGSAVDEPVPETALGYDTAVCAFLIEIFVDSF